MGNLYGCDKGTILKYAKDINYKNEITGKLTIDNKTEILSQYKEKTSNELADIYDVSRGQITKLWYDNKLSGKNKNRYSFDFDYFENIDTKDKAYFLGFLSADGNVFEKSKKTKSIKMTLQYEDRYILEVFKFCINCEKPLYTIERDSRKYSTLELISNKMFDDLSKYNIIPNKTYLYEMPKLEKFVSHFIRGYFDGDGSISISYNKFNSPSQYNISISGFEHNLLIIKNVLLENEIETIFVLDNRKYKYNFGQLVITNIKNKYKFLNFIYNNCDNLFLTRKKYKADSFFLAIKNKCLKNN